MVDMSKVQPNTGYADRRAAGSAQYAPRNAAGYKTGMTGRGNVAAAPAADPSAGGMWTPPEWDEYAQSMRAVMGQPYQEARGIGAGYNALQNAFDTGGWKADVSGYKAAADPFYARQQDEMRQNILQKMKSQGLSGGSVSAVQMARALGDIGLQREMDYANRDISAYESGAGRLAGLMPMFGNLAGLEQSGNADYMDRFMRAGQGLQSAGDRYYRAPTDYMNAMMTGGRGYNDTMMTDYEKYFGGVMNPGNGQAQQPANYMPSMGDYFNNNMLGNVMELWGKYGPQSGTPYNMPNLPGPSYEDSMALLQQYRNRQPIK